MKAILSDIHGNIEALCAVLEDIAHQPVDAVYNLGDTTGYGPNPIECLRLSKNMAVVLMGNLDLEVVDENSIGFAGHSHKSVIWTRELIQSREPDLHDYMSALPRSCREGKALYVHGSARNPLNEFVFPEDIANVKKMAKIGEKFNSLCFAGHTHIPGIFVENGAGGWQFVTPQQCDNQFSLDGRKVICNVGSVGQPRDEDWRTGYVLFDGSKIIFRRVEYDIDATVAKIHAQPELDNWLAVRLREGC